MLTVVAELLIGYARCSTDSQDLTAQRDALTALGGTPDRIYVDHGLTGTNRARPGLREALAACRGGDVLVVSKLDRLARSVPDARDIADELTARQVKLNIGGSVHDPTDPVGKLLFNALAMVAEFEVDLLRLRTREGMKVAKAKGHLRGKPPKLKPPRRGTWWGCGRQARTPAPSWPNCSPSPAPRCTAPSDVPVHRPARRDRRSGVERAGIRRRVRPRVQLPRVRRGDRQR